MEKYSEVIGLPVICVESGKKIGIIKDIIFCIKFKEIKAFILEHKGIEIRKKVILLKDVISLGKDALVVNNHDCAITMNKVMKTEDFKYSGKIKGLKVYSKAGNDLGTVNDIIFDYKNGVIEGVEVSDGFFQDIVLGRKVVPMFGKVEVGSETIMVDKEAMEEIRTTGGGLKKIINGESNIEDDTSEIKK